MKPSWQACFPDHCPCESPSLRCPQRWWVSSPLKALPRMSLSLFWPIAKLYSLGILWQYVGCLVGKRHHWSEHQSQSQLSDAAFFEVNEEYSTFEQVTGACSQKTAQVCQENSLFWSVEGSHWKQTYGELQEKNVRRVCYHPGGDSKQLYIHGNPKRWLQDQERSCRFFPSLSFTEELWCHWKSVPPG